MRLKKLQRNSRKSKKKTLQSTNLEEDTISKNQNSEYRKAQPKYYSSIYDCKLINYDKVLQTGDTRYLYKKEFWSNLPKKRLDKVFDDLFWEYQEESGLDDNLKTSIEYKAKIADLQLEQLTKRRNNTPRIVYFEKLLKGLNKGSGERQGLSKKLAILSKYMGYNISPEITLFEYIGIEKLYTEYAKSTVNK